MTSIKPIKEKNSNCNKCRPNDLRDVAHTHEKHDQCTNSQCDATKCGINHTHTSYVECFCYSCYCPPQCKIIGCQEDCWLNTTTQKYSPVCSKTHLMLLYNKIYTKP